MPTYEYACKSCGQHLEAVQSFTDDALTTCPNCAGQLRKVFGNIGIAFKGSGFYKNDSRSAKSSHVPPNGSSGGQAPGGSDGGSSSESTSSPSKDKDSGSSGSGSGSSGKESSGPSGSKDSSSGSKDSSSGSSSKDSAKAKPSAAAS